MTWKELFSNTFRALAERLGFPKDRKHLVELCRADDSDFCQEVVAQGLLTQAQMAHAAARFHLGKSKSGKCIFWMIDDRGRVRDGHLEQSWVSQLLKAREARLLQRFHPRHCLFGLHQLPRANNGAWRNCDIAKPKASNVTGGPGPSVSPSPISIVESERSAIILSELFPENLWMATVYPANFTIEKLSPLRGHKIKLYPRTDPTMETYLSWCDLATQARHLYHLDITVSPLLEQNATPAQKQKEIDLVDFLFQK